MQDLNNHIDDLFRKAAANYSLREEQDNWEKVAPFLSRSILLSPSENSNRSRGFKTASFIFIAAVLLIVFMPLSDTKQKHSTTGNFIHLPSKINDNAIAEKLIPMKNSEGEAVVKRKKHQLPGENNLPIPFENITEGRLHPTTVSPIATIFQKPEVTVTVNVPEFTPRKISPVYKHRFYLGMAVGPSVNQVKNQGLQKTGYDIGFIAGFQLNKKLAIETGVTYAKKYYFSDGKYFKMDKAGSGMPSGMKILQVNGSSDIFEIPVKLKYNIKTPKENHFYLTAGLSTYILTGEFNKYKAYLNGAAQDINGKYGSNKNYAAAAINYSIGYEIKSGKSTQVRIEPYMQIPLKGVGIGALPVTTAGLHLSITKKIF